MAESLETPRLSLPLLAPGQAQKEMTHNEALTMIDALIFPVAVAASVNVPPAEPLNGQSWIIGNSPTGLWAGKAGQLATATMGGWRFTAIPVGAWVRVGTAGHLWRNSTAGWVQTPEITGPSGGSTIDSEARLSINAIVQILADAGILKRL